MAKLGLPAAELSALRLEELEPLVAMLPLLSLQRFAYISLHAPSGFDAAVEETLIRTLRNVVAHHPDCPIILHPDAMHTPKRWRELGQNLCIENMDERKPIGRSADELDAVFATVPDATLCFDIGHAWQIDRTMGEAQRIYRRFKRRIRQIHISEVTTASAHVGLTISTITAYRKIIERLADLDVPFILESVVPLAHLANEVQAVRELIATARTTVTLSD